MVKCDRCDAEDEGSFDVVTKSWLHRTELPMKVCKECYGIIKRSQEKHGW